MEPNININARQKLPPIIPKSNTTEQYVEVLIVNNWICYFPKGSVLMERRNISETGKTQRATGRWMKFLQSNCIIPINVIQNGWHFNLNYLIDVKFEFETNNCKLQYFSL